ncbi:MAG: hypothetical protein KOO61_03715 [Spirochaetales bacterium]|nr:hypothetical protein [Spirochaetales bacterium]
MQLIVFHYHLLPGGVTDVILHSIQAVTAHRSDISSVRLVCGREENADTVIAGLDEIGVPVELDVLHELDYTPTAEPTDVALERADRLESVLLARYASEDAFWWVHNFHVGKNPAFTLALCRIAGTEASPRMLLHIHDFPECARYENLAYLTRITGESPYPAGPAVRYVVINARDRALMGGTNIPDDHVHLLVNPLPQAADPDGARPGKSALVSALGRFAADNGQQFDPDGPLLLYPIRTIRRKNVLEMVLLARLAAPANLIVTLPGVSNAERPYSNLIAEAFASGASQGVWGIGRREHGYDLTFQDLTHGADVIVSSSVQEGFGLLFVNALRWRVPLFARHLSILDGVSSIFENYPARFYANVQVPMNSPSISSLRAYLRMRYVERLDELGEFLPATARDRLDGQLEDLLSASSIDFAYLPPDMQYAYLRDLTDPAFASEIDALNRESVDDLMTVESQDCPDASARVEQMFGFRAFADRFDRVVRSYDQAGTAPPAGPPPAPDVDCRRYETAQQTLVEGFADLEYLRLLFAPMGDNHG